MEWPTGGQWFLLLLSLIFFSLMAGFLHTWLDERKHQKEIQERRKRLWKQ